MHLYTIRHFVAELPSFAIISFTADHGISQSDSDIQLLPHCSCQSSSERPNVLPMCVKVDCRPVYMILYTCGTWVQRFKGVFQHCVPNVHIVYHYILVVYVTKSLDILSPFVEIMRILFNLLALCENIKYGHFFKKKSSSALFRCLNDTLRVKICTYVWFLQITAKLSKSLCLSGSQQICSALCVLTSWALSHVDLRIHWHFCDMV